MFYAMLLKLSSTHTLTNEIGSKNNKHAYGNYSN